MALTTTAIRNAKPHDKAQRLYDSGGLYRATGLDDLLLDWIKSKRLLSTVLIDF